MEKECSRDSMAVQGTGHWGQMVVVAGQTRWKMQMRVAEVELLRHFGSGIGVQAR